MVWLALAKECEPPFFHSVSWAVLSAKKWGLVFRLEFLFLFVQAKRKEEMLLDTLRKSIGSSFFKNYVPILLR
jgi:hypothetical protein